MTDANMNTPSSTATTEEMVTPSCAVCGEPQDSHIDRIDARPGQCDTWRAGVSDGLVERRCSICTGTTFTAVDVRQFNGTYAPGPERRCVECKTTFTAQAFAALSARPSPPKVDATIPEGMVPWAGGGRAPKDWDGGLVLCRDGALWNIAYRLPYSDDETRWGIKTGSVDCADIIAYTPVATKADATDGEQLARRFHEIYERRAPEFGYETRTETRAFDPTTPNGRLMVAVCSEIASPTRGAEDTQAEVVREAEKRGEQRAVARLVEAARAISFQAGVGGRETAGAIVSYLATSPDEIAPFVAGTLTPLDFNGDWMRGGCLTWHGVNGQIVSPAALQGEGSTS